MTKRYATIDDMFRNTVEQYPDKTAIIFKEDKITFSTLNKSVSRLRCFKQGWINTKE